MTSHSIQTSGPPVREPLRRIPHFLKDTVSAEIKKMLNQGVIRESNSPWSSAVVMVRKKDNTWRFCVDYRKLNSQTQKDAYPLPRIDETLELLAGSKYFSTLDLASGYWQVEVEEADREKTAFSTRDGHYEFNVMPFGLTNAPATFQRLMQCVLSGLTYEQCLIYLDDIVVFGGSFQQHLERLKTVFLHLKKAGMKLKPSKCHFMRSGVRYLGHVVSRGGIQADPEKIQAMVSHPVPNDIKELRQFLGLTNYYRRFIKDYSKIAEPLRKLTRKSAGGYKWSADCQGAFEALKLRLTSPPTLAYPDFNHQFTVATDASGTALGAVLSQVIENKERGIAYWSRQLNKAERNYSTVEREALAVVCAVKEFFPYLYGRPFILLTDHNPLTSLRGLSDVGGRLTCWVLFLQQFDMTIQYQSGKSHGNAEGMSRRQHPLNDTKQSPVIPEEVSINGIELMGNLDALRQEQANDTFIKGILQAIQNGEKLAPAIQRWGKYLLVDGVLCRQSRNSYKRGIQIVVPEKL